MAAATLIGFQMKEELGRGASAVVRRAEDTDGNVVVIKTVIGEEHRNFAEAEFNALQMLDHPGIPRCFEAADEAEGEVAWRMDGEGVHLIMEHVRGEELFRYVHRTVRESPKSTKVPIPVAREIFRQLVDIIHHCHSRSVAHRDIKPENILITEDLHVTLIDFGFSTITKPGELVFASSGSLSTSPPEVFMNARTRGYDGFAGDVWSLGVILYWLLVGMYPFWGYPETDLLPKMKRGIYVLPSYLPSGARDLITRMLVLRPAERIPLDEVRTHPWMLSQGEE